jgi:hypothetical protein
MRVITQPDFKLAENMPFHEFAQLVTQLHHETEETSFTSISSLSSLLVTSNTQNEKLFCVCDAPPDLSSTRFWSPISKSEGLISAACRNLPTKNSAW